MFLNNRSIVFLLISIVYSLNSFALGTFQALVFENGVPLENYEISLDGVELLKSSADGLIFKDLKNGRHFIEVKETSAQEDSEKGDGLKIKSIPFVIADGETTQILINTFSNGKDKEFEVSEPEIPVTVDPNAPKGTFQGIVRSEDGPVEGAKIYLSGISDTYTTDSSGRWKAEVPEGRYSISIIHKLYATRTLAQQSVMKGKTQSLNTQLFPTGLELEEFVVVAPHVKGSLASLIEVRRKSSTVADVLGAEQMSKSGDSNAAASLARVTGLTVVNGKFVYIRGLGERYSNVLLNGTTLPSPDPTRRVVQLDLFPSGILDSMVITKSYTPELPGSFGGGAVDLRTKDIPEDFNAKVTLSTSYESDQGTVRTYEGGQNDWLGIDDGTRALPSAIADATAGGRTLPSGSEEAKELGKAFNKNYTVKNQRSGLPPGLSMSVGDTLKYRGKKFGYNIAGLYRDRWSNDNFDNYDIDEFNQVTGSRQTERSQREINLSGMLNLGADFGKYADIRSNTLMLRKTIDRIEKRKLNTQDNNLEQTSLQWQERQLFSQILNGKHQLGSNKKRIFSWRGSYSQALMDQPDTKFYQHVTDTGTPIFDTDSRSNERYFGEVKDVVQEGEAKIQLPIVETSPFSLTTKIGANITEKKRESDYKRFKYDINTTEAARITGNDRIAELTPEQICTDAVIDGGACTLVDTTGAADRFEADQQIRSYFIDTESSISDLARVNLGVRYEDSIQNITTYQGSNRDKVENSLLMQDFLPSAGLTYFLTEKMQVRLGYSETISRPAFKDLNPSAYYDDERDREINGNTNLKGTIIKNIDARIEWYFGNQENISFGLFSKDFTNPIEEVAGAFDDEGNLTYSETGYQLANIGNAKAQGFEIEFRKNFGFISPFLEDLALGGNYAKIDSEVTIFDELSAQVTNSTRPLQGQSPYVVNVNLDYDNKDWGTNATILYNVFGERVDTVGTQGLPDIYQQPFHQLDFVFQQKFGADFKNKVKFKVQNLINPEAELTQGGVTKQIYRKGRRASLSYTRTF
ncbi:MAG: hypothetical protein CME63_17570 [Halobacteriovoraceae bacterium]|nr:hypothetical protein [Halobacteriovoraceae bacterium]MBC99558.1 hypothetical protein [Halobacteriovoraceae bacterium]|tara:strand:- start:29824 stop:32919 length:3096 start_codon:yes stop_codon:yes gene_type:complete